MPHFVVMDMMFMVHIRLSRHSFDIISIIFCFFPRCLFVIIVTVTVNGDSFFLPFCYYQLLFLTIELFFIILILSGILVTIIILLSLLFIITYEFVIIIVSVFMVIIIIVIIITIVIISVIIAVIIVVI